jgi:hypothetical protein
MVAKNAREVLKKENELLNELAQKTSTMAKNSSGAEADVLNAWERYFRRHREINDDLIKKTDSAFDQELNDEIARLERMRDANSGTSAVQKNSRASRGEDIEIARKLL